MLKCRASGFFMSMPPRARGALLLAILFAAAMGYYHLEIFLPHARAMHAAHGLGERLFLRQRLLSHLAYFAGMGSRSPRSLQPRDDAGDSDRPVWTPTRSPQSTRSGCRLPNVFLSRVHRYSRPPAGRNALRRGASPACSTFSPAPRHSPFCCGCDSLACGQARTNWPSCSS